MLHRNSVRRPSPFARLRRPTPPVAPPESFVRRFDRCFDLVYALLRAHADEATARRLTRQVLLENLDLLLPAAGREPGEPHLGREARARLLASMRIRPASPGGARNHYKVQ